MLLEISYNNEAIYLSIPFAMSFTDLLITYMLVIQEILQVLYVKWQKI